MSATPDSTLADPQRIIADLQRQLAALHWVDALAAVPATEKGWTG